MTPTVWHDLITIIKIIAHTCKNKTGCYHRKIEDIFK